MPAPKARPPLVEVEVLEDHLPSLTRPLSLANGRAYAVTWPHVRHTTTAVWNKRLIQYDRLASPLVALRQAPLVLRDDGVAYGEAGENPLTSLPFLLDLHAIPPAHTLWSPPGIQAYRTAHRPFIDQTFARLADVFDHFVDFECSLAPQRLMAEFMAVFTLSTWFTEAFHTLGALWIMGEGRSGKSRLLQLVARFAHLGTPLLVAEISAALRDLVAYGATLAFDDAHLLLRRRAGDADLRALLAAGTRHAAYWPIKHAVGGGGLHQRLRAVSTFYPRLFAAPSPPPPSLAPHVIIVPLVASADSPRLSRDPHHLASWPSSPADLLSDLWAVALSSLPSLSSYAAQLPALTSLVGRDLDLWRSCLTVARWLTDLGLPGLFDRLHSLALSYRTDFPQPLHEDLTGLIIQAIMSKVTGLTGSTTPGETSNQEYWHISTDDVIRQANFLLTRETLVQPKDLTHKFVGDLLGRLRLHRPPREWRDSHYKRLWRVYPRDLRRWSLAYNLPLPPSLDQPGHTSADLPPQPSSPP